MDYKILKVEQTSNDFLNTQRAMPNKPHILTLTHLELNNFIGNCWLSEIFFWLSILASPCLKLQENSNASMEVVLTDMCIPQKHFEGILQYKNLEHVITHF